MGSPGEVLHCRVVEQLLLTALEVRLRFGSWCPLAGLYELNIFVYLGQGPELVAISFDEVLERTAAASAMALQMSFRQGSQALGSVNAFQKQSLSPDAWEEADDLQLTLSDFLED